MLPKTTIEKMGALLGINKTALKEAIDNEDETDVDIPGDITVLSKPALDLRDKTKYNEGKIAGEEIAVKEIKRNKNIDFEGKTVADLVEHLAHTPEKDLALTDLRDKLTAAERDNLELQNQLSQNMIKHAVLTAIPHEYNGMKKHELKAIAEANGFEFRLEDGKTVPYRHGQKVQDPKEHTDLDATTALKAFFEAEKGMKPHATPAGYDKRGRGDGNRPGAKTPVLTKASEIQKQWQEENPGKSINGADFNNHMATAFKAAKEAGQTVEMDI